MGPPDGHWFVTQTSLYRLSAQCNRLGAAVSGMPPWRRVIAFGPLLLSRNQKRPRSPELLIVNEYPAGDRTTLARAYPRLRAASNHERADIQAVALETKKTPEHV